MRNYSSASPATSIQNVELSWDTKAQNLLISYNKSRTFTTATLVEIIALIQQARSEIPVVGGGNGNGNGNDDTNPTLPEELTAEQIRDKLQTLEANARLDASSIKNISKNVFVRVDGADMVLQDFMELLFEYIRKSGALTREAIIEKLGFEPFNSSKVVQDLTNPQDDEVISTEGLKTILENFDGKKFSTTFGDGIALDFTFTHNLNTDFVMFELRNGSTRIFASPTAYTLNSITFNFAIAPASETLIIVWS